MSGYNKQTYAWLIWFVAALFYSIEFMQRVAPGVIATPLMQAYKIDPETLGFIISFYFYAYGIAQIPVGVILDRYGARLSLALAALAVSIGTFLFASTNSLIILSLARIIVGIGSAFAFVGCLKLANSWFKAKNFGLVVGLTNTLGVAGALFGEEPLAKLIHHYGWRHTLMATAIAGVMIAILIVLIVRNYPKGESQTLKKQSSREIFGKLCKIAKSKQAWLIAIYAGLMVAPVIAFAELWAVTFLQKAHAVNAGQAAFINSFIFIGIGVGGPLNGWISGLIGKRKLIMFIGNLMALLLLLAIIWAPIGNTYLLEATLFFFGAFTSSMLLCFPLNTESNPKELSATVIAFTNMMIMITGALFQPFIGYLVKVIMRIEHVTQFSANEFRLALMCLPIALLINLAILYFIRESKSCNSRLAG